MEDEEGAINVWSWDGMQSNTRDCLRLWKARPASIRQQLRQSPISDAKSPDARQGVLGSWRCLQRTLAVWVCCPHKYRHQPAPAIKSQPPARSQRPESSRIVSLKWMISGTNSGCYRKVIRTCGIVWHTLMDACCSSLSQCIVPLLCPLST